MVSRPGMSTGSPPRSGCPGTVAISCILNGASPESSIQLPRKVVFSYRQRSIFLPRKAAPLLIPSPQRDIIIIR